MRKLANDVAKKADADHVDAHPILRTSQSVVHIFGGYNNLQSTTMAASSPSMRPMAAK